MALDLTKAKPTPPPARGPRAAKTPAPLAQDRIERRAESLGGLFGLGAAGLLMLGQGADSQALTMHGPGIALETAKLAETNEKIAKAADWLDQVGPYAGLLTAVLPLILQLAVNHDRMPAGIMGTTTPDVLQAQAQANAARAAATMLEAQNEARRDAQEQIARAQAAFAEANAGASDAA